MAGLTSKVDINLGYGCNCKCPFCYYYDSVITNTNLNTLTTEQAKQQLRRARRLGIKEIEFTGGEVTLRKDLVELVQFCKFELGFKLVSIITNGMALAKREYTNRLVAAGVDDVLFSLHGHNSEIHDQLTVTPGSFENSSMATLTALVVKCILPTPLFSPQHLLGCCCPAREAPRRATQPHLQS